MAESYLLSAGDVQAIKHAIDGIARLETGLNLLNGGGRTPPISSHGWIGVVQSALTGGCYTVNNATVTVNATTHVWTVTARTSSDPAYLSVTACNIKEIVSRAESLASGTIVYVMELPASAGATSPNYLILGSSAASLFPVTLTQSGGSNGSQTSAATYTYIVKSISGTTLGTTGTTPIQPTWARDFGSVNTATHGTAYYDDSGNLVLYQADETPTTSG
ncbi:MAG: hypothetical protein KGL39_28680, partial [Patescibacteria group bacterium]|nr:hypothetical protein [Patescibacteria group bacterium]